MAKTHSPSREADGETSDSKTNARWPHDHPVGRKCRDDFKPPSSERYACRRQAHRRSAGSSGFVVRIAAHPIGAPVCLALGYMVLCGAYIILSERIAASAARPVVEFHNLEQLKGLAFVLVTGAAYFWFASRMLKRIASQQKHLALIFQGVSDCLLLIRVEAEDRYRFICVNSSGSEAP